MVALTTMPIRDASCKRAMSGGRRFVSQSCNRPRCYTGLQNSGTRRAAPFDRAIDVQVSRLRHRLRDDARDPAIDRKSVV